MKIAKSMLFCLLGKIFYCCFVLQRYLNSWYLYLKIQILEITKLQSQKSSGIACKDIEAKKLEFCFWDTTHCIDKFPPPFSQCPPSTRRAYPTSCMASCSGTPFIHSRSSASSSIMFGFSCILQLTALYTSQIYRKTQQRPSKSH